MKLTDQKLPILVSYAYLRESKPEAIERLLTDSRYEVLLDSGGFTAFNAGKEIPLADYLDFLAKWQAQLFGYMALDKVQDPVTTDKNLQIMLAKGFEPIPIHVFGDGAKRMDELFGYSEWVALAGLRRPHRGQAPIEYLKQKMVWAKGRKVHWLGYIKEGPIRAMKPFSCDSASWKAAPQFGRVEVYLGRGEWEHFTYAELAAAGPHRLSRRVCRELELYGVPMAEFLDERYWRVNVRKHGIPTDESVVWKLPARSWIRYVLEVKRQFGTRVFLACDPSNMTVIDKALGALIKAGI